MEAIRKRTEKSLAFQNAEVSRMKTKVKIMERAVIEQRKIAERLKKSIP